MLGSHNLCCFLLGNTLSSEWVLCVFESYLIARHSVASDLVASLKMDRFVFEGYDAD